ncbi:flagellar biosynthesis protein FlhB [bacterium]|jgi:flagellar biosynthetic protein FlhB|nr:flagellar biosynthesis protein FlhB [bacterium]
MGDDSGEKTEEPTPHKMREARKKGQIAKSKEITGAVLMIVAFAIFKATAKSMWDRIANLSNYTFGQIPEEFSAATVGVLLRYVLITSFACLLPILVTNTIIALIIEALQTGFLVSGDPLIPKFSKLNPLEGVKKFFSAKQYVELAKSLIKMGLVIMLLYGAIKDEFFMVLIGQQLSLWQLMEFTGHLVVKVINRLAGLYFVIAIFDYLYQKHEHIKGLKMSKKEIKDEYKRLEGDPQIKQRQKDAARQMSQGRQMGSVPGADVVVTNPVYLALAIRYKHNSMRAPVLVAKGKRLVAKQIKQLALENNIPIIENPPLAQALYPITEVNAEVPPEYYKLVAEILAFVYNLKKKRAYQ